MEEHRVVAAIKQLLPNPGGWCYAASETVYHLCGGKEAGYTPIHGPGHWWLRRKDGSFLDVTQDQFIPGWYPYHKGRGCGFQTKQPSKRAQELIEKVKECLQSST